MDPLGIPNHQISPYVAKTPYCATTSRQRRLGTNYSAATTATQRNRLWPLKRSVLKLGLVPAERTAMSHPPHIRSSVPDSQGGRLVLPIPNSRSQRDTTKNQRGLHRG